MNRVNFTLFELTQAEVIKLDYTAQILIYNPYSEKYSLAFADKNCIARSKFALPALRYFLFNVAELPRV